MTLKHRARTLLQDRLRIDVQRFPGNDPGRRLARLLAAHNVQTVVDVGANNGGYGSLLRRHGYAGEIVSFEPLANAWMAFREVNEGDPLWTGLKMAIGPEYAEAELNVAGNAGASSSLLPMLSRHSEAAPEADYVRTEKVNVMPLDEALRLLHRDPFELTAPHHLKIDVQGYERGVLQGCPDLLASPELVGLQMELSLVPLYDGAWTWREAVDFAESHGFHLEALIPGFSDPTTGQMLQVDGILFR